MEKRELILSLMLMVRLYIETVYPIIMLCMYQCWLTWITIALLIAWQAASGFVYVKMMKRSQSNGHVSYRR